LNGSPLAQEKLYKKYKQLVKNFIKCRYSIYYDIEDDVSEIMIKVFMNLNTFDSTKSKFRSWVFSIAKNYMIDKWRSKGCTSTLISNNATYTSSIDCQEISLNNSGFISSSGVNNLAFTSNGTCISCNTDFENCNSINYISTQLSPTDFTLLDMKYVQGYDYNEIGKEFNVTSSTISNRVNYIKSKLKKNNPEIIYD